MSVSQKPIYILRGCTVAAGYPPPGVFCPSPFFVLFVRISLGCLFSGVAAYVLRLVHYFHYHEQCRIAVLVSVLHAVMSSVMSVIIQNERIWMPSLS